MATSVPSSFAYALNAIIRGSFDSTSSESQLFISLAASSLPSLRRCVPMKMNGSDVAVFLLGARRGDRNRPLRVLSPGDDDACRSWPVHAGALVAGDSKQQSRLLNAFELVHAAIFEAKAGAGDEVAHGRRYEDLARTSECRNPRSCVHCDPAYCLADPLDFT